MSKKKLSALFCGGSLLHITFMAGIILFVIISCLLTVFYFIDRSQSRTIRQQDGFYRLMREFDISWDVFVGTEREMEQLSRELDRMERRTIGVESWLSVLKRRRALANRHPPLLANYHSSIERAQKAYPLSQTIAALAAAALVKDTALTKEKEETLRTLFPLLTDSTFNNLRLSLHILLGDFSSPERALQIPYPVNSDGTEIITQNLAILKILNNDNHTANADIQTVLNSPVNPSAGFIRFAAEYYYDFGNLLRSAELFSLLEDDSALLRQADALFLAGYTGSARSLWSILAENFAQNKSAERGLYNLAVCAENDEEAAVFLERLVNIYPPSNTDARKFALIRYSRQLEHYQAMAVLQNDEVLRPSRYPLIDLEICKREARFQEPRRRLAEAWLLMDRHYESEELFWWAAWVMSFQRFYSELEILLSRLEQNGFTYHALFYRAILLMQEGDIETAENMLRVIPAEYTGWAVHANLGRILEVQRFPARAMEEYELAAALVQNPKAASNIYVRIARCFSVLGRTVDAILALETALSFDPENLTARLDLDRTY